MWRRKNKIKKEKRGENMERKEKQNKKAKLQVAMKDWLCSK